MEFLFSIDDFTFLIVYNVYINGKELLCTYVCDSVWCNVLLFSWDMLCIAFIGIF